MELEQILKKYEMEYTDIKGLRISENTLKDNVRFLRATGLNEFEIFDENKLLKYINGNTYWGDTTKRKYLIKASGFLRFFDKPNEKLKTLNIERQQKEIESNRNAVNELPRRGDLIEKWRTIKNDYHKILLYFFVKVAPLRTDLASLKLGDYNEKIDNYYNPETNEMIFNSLAKINKKMTIKLDDEFKELYKKANLTNEFLYFESEGIEMNVRRNRFGKFVSKISKLYFGEKLTINDYRHICVNETYEKVKEKPLGEIFDEFKKLAKQMNNSATVILDNYLQVAKK